MMRLGGGEEELAESHDINVTPFIDVMLVLLIIFMVAAPLATVNVPVNMPPARAQPQPRPDKPVFLTIAAGGSLAVGEAPVTQDALGPALRAAGADGSAPVFVRADKGLSYGGLMAVLNLLQAAGFTKVSLVGLDARSAP